MSRALRVMIHGGKWGLYLALAKRVSAKYGIAAMSHRIAASDALKERGSGVIETVKNEE